MSSIYTKERYPFRVRFMRKFTGGTLAGTMNEGTTACISEKEARVYAQKIVGMEVAGLGSPFRILWALVEKNPD